jgi:hypothetical protein
VRIILGQWGTVLTYYFLNQVFPKVRSLHSFPHAEGDRCLPKRGLLPPQVRKVIIARPCLVMITPQLGLITFLSGLYRVLPGHKVLKLLIGVLHE